MEQEKRLEDLVTYPREDLNVEIKGWLDLSDGEAKANLAKAAIAIANYGGGYIVIGFVEKDGTYEVAEPRPHNLAQYNQDDINSIINKYAEPQFHCEVNHVQHPITKIGFPVISVPGSSKVPIRSKRHGPNGKHITENAYYIRRPGPKSEVPQSGKEWDELIGRCIRSAKEDLLEDFRSILYGVGKVELPKENATDILGTWIASCDERWNYLIHNELSKEIAKKFDFGQYTVAYRVIGKIEEQSLADFLELLRKVEGHETGWPPWWVPTRSGIAPYPIDDLIECWLGREKDDPAHSDFWRASPTGFAYLKRGFQEDSFPEKGEPGKYFDLVLPVWRTGECLLHAHRLAKALSAEDGQVEFEISWRGLSNRQMVVWGNSNRMLFGKHIARQDYYARRIVVPVEDIKKGLPEIVAALTKPLFEIFDFLRPPENMYSEELSHMLKK